jgi:hypothetical protein
MKKAAKKKPGKKAAMRMKKSSGKKKATRKHPRTSPRESPGSLFDSPAYTLASRNPYSLLNMFYPHRTPNTSIS